jgi:hypothetical protein
MGKLMTMLSINGEVVMLVEGMIVVEGGGAVHNVGGMTKVKIESCGMFQQNLHYS